MDVALTPPGADQVARWCRLMQDLFNPLRMAADNGRRDRQARRGTALRLSVPSTGDLPSLRLEYANGGRRLFSSRDAALASELRAMLVHALESRQSYERGVAEERERIARDMHDNIGVQLLGALAQQGDAAKGCVDPRNAVGSARYRQQRIPSGPSRWRKR